MQAQVTPCRGRSHIEGGVVEQKTSTTPPTMLSHLSHAVSVYTCIYGVCSRHSWHIHTPTCVCTHVSVHCTSWGSSAYGRAWCTVCSPTIKIEKQREPQHPLCSFPPPVCVYVCCVCVGGGRMWMWCACYSPLYTCINLFTQFLHQGVDGQYSLIQHYE